MLRAMTSPRQNGSGMEGKRIQMRNDVSLTVVAGACLWLGLLCAASSASAANATWNGFTYAVTSNEVTILSWQPSATALEIPAEIDGKPVRSIGQKAFAQKRELQNVILPDSVRQIGVLAFELCNGLTNVVLGKAVERLCDGAFASCYELRDVRLPEGLVSVGSGAFQDCRKLSRVVLPASLRALGDGAFTGCFGLKAVELAAGNESFVQRDGVLFNRELTTLYRYPPSSPRSEYIIPDSVTRIAGNAFESCRGLRAVTIPSSVTNIGNGAFLYCEKLGSIAIPEGVTRIASKSFDECRSLTNVVFGSRVTNICSEAFFRCASLRRVVIPDSVTALGDSAFSECGNLEYVTLGSGIERLGTWVFGSGSALKQIRLPDSLKRIGSNAFAGCGITNLVLGPNVNDIDIYTLGGIPNLVIVEENQTYRLQQGVLFNRDMTTLVRYPANRKDAEYRVPDGVTTVGTRAFMHAYWLKSCPLPATVKNIGEYAFCHSGLEELTLPDSVTVIEGCAFMGCESLRSVRSLGSITLLDSWTFGSNPKLTRVVLPATLKKLEQEFTNCPNLAEFVVAEGNTAFRTSDGVLFNRAMTELLRYPTQRKETEYRVPDGITTVGASAFAGVASLTKLSFSATVTNIGAGAFQRTTLRQVSISAGIRQIGRQAFGSCPQLDTVLFEGDRPPLNADIFANTPATVCYREGAKGWTNDTAYGKTALGVSTDGCFHFSVQNGQTVSIRRYLGTRSDVRVPAWLACLPVTAIGAQAFASNDLLSSVTIPASVTGIAKRAFVSCASLESVFFEGHAPSADTDLFGNSPASIYHRLDAQGWDAQFAGRPALACSYDSGFAFLPDPDGSMVLVRCFDTNRTVIVPAETDGKPVGVIGPKAFAGCRELTGVTIPASVRRIGARAFDNCYRLASVAGATHVTEVGAAAFESCYSLTNAVVAGQQQGNAAPAGDDAAGRVSLRLRMANGDTLTGSTTRWAAPLRMGDAMLIVPFAHMSTIKPGTGDAADSIRLRKGEMLEGKIALKEIEVKGKFGLAAIDLRQISELVVAPADSITREP